MGIHDYLSRWLLSASQHQRRNISEETAAKEQGPATFCADCICSTVYDSKDVGSRPIGYPELGWQQAYWYPELGWQQAYWVPRVGLAAGLLGTQSGA